MALRQSLLSSPFFSDLGSEPLSDDQIQQLLIEAETRLKSANEESLVAKDGKHTRLPRLDPGKVERSYLEEKDGVAQVDSSRLLDKEQRRLGNELRVVEEPVSGLTKVEKKVKQTAGTEWFDLPRTVVTPSFKREMQMIEMRSVLDPHRHYKKEKTKIPNFSQVGTVIEGPTEYYSARIDKKDRKKTFVEEIMAAEESSGRFKRKYQDVQAAKTSGKKAHYKALVEKRKKPKG